MVIYEKLQNIWVDGWMDKQMDRRVNAQRSKINEWLTNGWKVTEKNFSHTCTKLLNLVKNYMHRCSI